MNKDGLYKLNGTDDQVEMNLFGSFIHDGHEYMKFHLDGRFAGEDTPVCFHGAILNGEFYPVGWSKGALVSFLRDNGVEYDNVKNIVEHKNSIKNHKIGIFGHAIHTKGSNVKKYQSKLDEPLITTVKLGVVPVLSKMKVNETLILGANHHSLSSAPSTPYVSRFKSSMNNTMRRHPGMKFHMSAPDTLKRIA